MKIIFEASEIDSLPDDAREKLGDDLEIEVVTLSELASEFEDVVGLKSALGKARTNARKYEGSTKQELDQQLEAAKADNVETLAERDGEIASLKTQLGERDATITGLETDIKTTSQDAKIAEAVSKHKGDLDLLRPHLRARLDENPEIDLGEIMPELKERHPGAFAASSQSGPGSDPGKGNDTHRIGITSLPMRRSEMSDKQKNEYQKTHGLDALLDLPA